ncbi:tripartite tricarboxylate transporter TctB family protein [Pseudonocardia eucalypti]|uniref:Tripartite tricarboxylate transporter TctB family protein n=1 Tax=Pseudonocardia eucalypti TaxID=648755 RepID=A0ABP9PW69_9PSEU|nr:putative tricarboxylic transport membrane protein [Pseudonocardia eucalypti]
MSAPETTRAPERRSWLREHSELGISLLLLVTGVLVLTDTALETRGGGGGADPLGPHAVPLVVGIGLLVLAAVLTVDVLRGGHGEAELGEDIDLSTPPDVRTLGMLAGVLVATAALIPIVGWPLAGFVLFWGTSYALGSRHPRRDPLIAAGVSLTTWIVFDALLGVELPGGPLMGVFG